MYDSPYYLYLSGKCKTEAERISWKAVSCVGAHFNELWLVNISWQASPGHLNTQAGRTTFHKPVYSRRSQWPNLWLEHANVASLNLTQLFLLMRVKYLPLWVSAWIFCSKPCLIYSLIPSWCLATCNTNTGQVVYVCASVYTDQQSNSFYSLQIHQHERLWDISLLHSIRNHLQKKSWLQLLRFISIVKC